MSNKVCPICHQVVIPVGRYQNKIPGQQGYDEVYDCDTCDREWLKSEILEEVG